MHAGIFFTENVDNSGNLHGKILEPCGYNRRVRKIYKDSLIETVCSEKNLNTEKYRNFAASCETRTFADKKNCLT